MDGDLEQNIREASEPLGTYDSIRRVLVNEFSPIDLNTSEQREGECCHFSIRGYVANVHKRDKKICWPFFPIHRENNLDNDEDVLPAISVAQFRWWNCENCLLKDGVRKNDGFRESLEEDRAKISVPDVNVSAVGDATVQKLLLSSLPKSSTDPLLELMSMEEDHKSADSNGVGKIGGLYTMGIGSSQHEIAVQEDQHKFVSNRNRSFFQFKNAVVTGPHDGKACKDVHTVINNATTYCEQIPESEFSKERRLDNTTLDPCIGPIVLTQQNGAPKDDGTQMHEQSTGDPDCHNCEVTAKNDVNTKNEEDEHTDQPCEGNGTANRRKVQRTRALSDIIKSEVLRVSNRASLTTEDEATCDTKDKEKKHKSMMVPPISVHEASYNHSGKTDRVKEEVMPACKKHSKSKIVPTVSGDGHTHDDQSSKKNSTMKNNSKHTCKKYINSQKLTPSSADQATNTDDKDIRKPDSIENKVKSVCKKQKSRVPSSTSNVKVPLALTADKNGKKKDKLDGETNHVPKEHSSVALDKQKKKTKLKKKLARLKIEDEGSSLINWMKKTSTKVKAYKKSADPKHGDSSEFSPRTVSPKDGLPLRKKVRPTILGSGTRTGKFKRQKSSVEGQEGLLKQKSDITEHSASHGIFQEVNTGNSLRKSAKVSGSTAGSLNPDPPSLGRQIEKTTCNQEGEVVQPRDNRPLQISGQKDASSLLKDMSIEKQNAERFDQATDASSVDGIPVEILMLLQENYKKRHSDESVAVKEGIGTPLIVDIDDGKEGNSSTKTVHEASRELHEQQQQQECTTTTAQEATVKPHNKQRQQLEYTSRTDHDALIRPCKQRQQQRYPASSSGHCPLELKLLSAKNHREESHLTLGYQYDPSEKGNICMGAEYQASGKCKNLMNMRGKWDMSPLFSDFSNYRKVASDGLDPRSFSENANRFFLQDRDHLWVMNNKQNHVHDCSLSSHNPTGDRVGARASITLDMFPQVQDSPIPKCKEAHSKDAQAKRKRVMEEYEYMKALDRKFAQLQKHGMDGLQSELPHLQPAREYDAGAVRPPDLPTNETISALNLLRLMDPAVCSTTPICVPSNKNSGKLRDQSNNAYDYVPKGSFRGCSTEKIDVENKNPQHHSVNSNFYSPAPRLGLPIPFYLKDNTVDCRDHESKTSYYRPFMGTDNREARAYEQSNTRNVGNQPASQSEVPPCYPFLSPMNPFYGKMVQAGHKDKVGSTAQVRRNGCSVEICSVNRNPADFTIPGEDNEYMTRYEELQIEEPTTVDGREHLGYPENRRKRKALSLIATKGLLRS